METNFNNETEGAADEFTRTSENLLGREKIKEIKIEDKTLVFVVGLPASGKSTFATTHFPLDSIVSSDNIRGELTNNPRNQLVSDRAFEIARKIVSARLQSGKIAVVDAQNLTEDNRAQFYAVAEAAGAKVTAIFLDVSSEESIARDTARNRHVGASYIKGRRGFYEEAKRSLETSTHVNELHVLSMDEMNGALISLPESYAAEMETDREFLKESEASQFFIAGAETGFIKREMNGSDERIPVKAGAVLFVEGAESSEKDNLIKNNFLPHQVIDIVSLAKRLGVEKSDEAILDIIKPILHNRLALNLTTCVVYPPDFPFASNVKNIVAGAEQKRNIRITAPEIRILDQDSQNMEPIDQDNILTGFASINRTELSKYRIEVRRDAPDNSPLFLIGDVHGAYTAMRELAGNVRRENLGMEPNRQARQIVFVGDMADRGPLGAETVIYITALVRQGRAILVKGNHDENLLRGLKGEENIPADSNATLEELKRRLKPDSLQKIADVLEKAPLCGEWKNLVVVHASLPRIPRADETLSEPDARAEGRIMTHGARSGQYVGGRPEVWKLHNAAAKDPDVLAVGGHTHESEPVMDTIAGTVILDASVEMTGELWGMYYPELDLASAKEPSLVKLFNIMETGVLPAGEELIAFVHYLETQSLVDTKKGTGEYEGLTVVTYSGITEMSNAWEKYPILRNFRGLIMDDKGNIIARPFEKTHKAGDEIPLEKLDIIPDKVFEKANGSLGVAYFWNGKWRVATKFSFENDAYTKPALEMLSQMDKNGMDPAFTYLFEIILPDDSHFVDYGEKQDLILLNAINSKTGDTKTWEDVSGTATTLGVRTAEDMTEKFKGMTIHQIYDYAQREGSLPNYEGLMAEYTDETGKKLMVKVKTREYTDKKFVRDRLDWEDILEAFNKETMDISPEKRDSLLKYNYNNVFARAALEARIAWIQEEYKKIANQMKKFLILPLGEARAIYDETSAQGGREALGKAMKAAVPKLAEILKSETGKTDQNKMNVLMGFLRDIISERENPESRLASYAIEQITARIEEEKKKKGENSFWIIPAD
jgi:predicted kinase